MSRKLHEFLGSQSQVFGQGEKCRKDLLATFEKKRHLFEEKRKSYRSDAEGAAAVVEEESSIQSTVPSEIKWLIPILAKVLDSEATIDEGNTRARGDVKLDDGTVILTGVPVTQLLQLEKRLTELQQFVAGIPTLDPAKGFNVTQDRSFGIYQAREVNKRRTKKEAYPMVLAAATEHHPAQVQIVTRDVEVGTVQEQEWSGLTTPAVKSEMLSRVEELRRAVKQARARANDIQTEDIKIGGTLLLYVFEPVLGEAKK